MDAEAFVELGRVAKTHGLNGEVSVKLTGDLPFDRLEGVSVWFTPPPHTLRTSRIVSVRPGPKGPLFSFEGVSDISTADTLRGCNVLVRAQDVPEYDEEYDPVGLDVIDDERGPIGTVTDVIVTGANDVWIVEGRFGEVLIPVIESVVHEIDEEAMTVRVTLLPGLIEEGR
jgi:16S rRNA processing protein RimM